MTHLTKWAALGVLMLAMSTATAIDISSFRLVSVVTVTNLTGEDQGDPPRVVAVPISSQDMTDGGLISQVNWLDVEIHDANGNDVPFMVAWDRSGGLITPGGVTACTNDDGGVYQGDTTDCNDGGTNDIDFLELVPAVNDAFVVSAQHEFRKLWFDVSTPGERVGGDLWTVVWEYCSSEGFCSAGDQAHWIILTNVQDNTAAFSKAGMNSVSWEIPTDPPMGDSTVNTIAGFHVRARVTDVGTGTYTRRLGATAHFETAQWMILVDGLGVADSADFFIYAGSSGGRSENRFFPGADGFTTADDPDLELGSDFEIEIKGTFAIENNSGARAPIIKKGGSGTFLLESGASQIKAHANGVTLTAPSIFVNDEVTIRIDNDATDGFRLFVDETLRGSAAQQTVPDTADIWEFARGFVPDDTANGSTFYYEFIKITVSGVLQVHYETNAVVGSDQPIDNRVGNEEGAFVDRGGFPSLDSGILHKNFTAVVTPFQSTSSIDPSLGAAAGSDVVNDIDGSAEGTAFAAASAPSSNLPGFQFLNNMANKDYDPTQGGTQGIPVSFFYIVIAGGLIILVMVGVMIVSKSLLYAVIAAGVIATLFVSVTVISPWFLMWFAIPAVLLFLVKGPISL